ncbi:hypothetical protein ADK67_17770 [Saccharothrix sp. NRRL B-16348]|uniref:hypothetical protein n=1 Tax=Saccharothrix sp. NRRL B-16348 TaxID=1415542 RepID=UPI0006AF502D|nr:hypothetical protein [Saccharothrix sp. NRRL B-16348]KOX24801.1 hypothetical protein ADK67_17770 [Saccharothrix sp. NRRL B-16348]
MIPTPKVVALRAALDAVTAEDVPGWAAHWLVEGYDGDDLRTLAGLSGKHSGEVRDVLAGALADCGASIPPAAVASAALSCTHVAQMFVDGRAESRWVAQKVAEIVERLPADVLAELPMGHLADGADEAAVSRACADHLAAWG